MTWVRSHDPPVSLEPQDSDSESDVLRAIDPNMVFPSGTAGGDPTPESDSGIPEDPPPVPAPPTVYQVVYDVSGLGKVAEAPPEEGVISIELGEHLTHSELQIWEAVEQ